MAFNTGNPIGSTDPRDFSDNSENLDRAVNNTASATWTDRFGSTRTSLAGQIGYIGTGVDGAIEDYAAGQELATYSTIIRYSGEFYRPAAGATLPYTTTATTPDVDSNLVSVGDATLRQDLADNTVGAGSDLVAHAGTADTVTESLDKRTIYVGSVADLVAVTIPTDGAHYDVTGYHAGTDIGGGVFYYDASRSKADHNAVDVIDPDKAFPTITNTTEVDDWFTATNAGTGCFVRVPSNELNDDQAGVIAAASYNAFQAYFNRKAYEVLLRETGKGEYRFKSNANSKFILGSVHPLRDNFKITHEKGCDIKGRYDDTGTIAGSRQAGHIFGFVDYADPDFPTKDFTIAGSFENILYQLDGTIGSVFDAGHTLTHNNNPLGFVGCKNSHVRGLGGISESDHNGIVFDVSCPNCTIDVGFVRNVDSQLAVMSGDSTDESYNSVKIGEASGSSYDGRDTGGGVVIGETGFGTVYIGNGVFPSSNLRPFVSGNNIKQLRLSYGYVENCLTLFRNSASVEEIHIEGGRWSNVTSMVSRGGLTDDGLKVVQIKNNRCVSQTANHTIYLDQNEAGGFDRLSVINNDWSAATGAVDPYDGASAGFPGTFDFKDNVTPSGWVYTTFIENRISEEVNTVASSPFNFDAAGTNGDKPYAILSVLLSEGGFRWQENFYIEDFLTTSVTYRRELQLSAGTAVLELSRSGTVITVTLSGVGTISSYTLRN